MITLKPGQRFKKARGLTTSVAAVNEDVLSASEVLDYVKATEMDATLNAVVEGVREAAEQYTGKLLVRREVVATWRTVPLYGKLPWGPDIDITKVERSDSEGEWEETSYYTRGERRVYPSGGATYGLRVTYEAGFENLPPALRMQMLRDVSTWYDQRSNVVATGVQRLPQPSAYDRWKTIH